MQPIQWNALISSMELRTDKKGKDKTGEAVYEVCKFEISWVRLSE